MLLYGDACVPVVRPLGGPVHRIPAFAASRFDINAPLFLVIPEGKSPAALISG